jgi:hypothetical protein
VSFVLLLSVLLSGCAGAQHDVTLDASCPHPTALIATGEGGLFVASSEVGRVYRTDGDRCTELPGAFPRASGLAILRDGTLCVGHAGSDDPLQRRSVVSCRDPDGWTERIGNVGSGVNGLLAAQDGLWMLGWRDTPVERRDGLVTRVRGGEVVRQVELEGDVPRFGAVVPGGALWISVARSSVDGTVRPGLVRLDASDALLRLDPPVRQPEGIAYDRDRDGVWIADAAAGALVLVALDETERARVSGLDRPAGVAVSDRYGVCVAETRTNRVRCFGGVDAGGGSS